MLYTHTDIPCNYVNVRSCGKLVTYAIALLDAEYEEQAHLADQCVVGIIAVLVLHIPVVITATEATTVIREDLVVQFVDLRGHGPAQYSFVSAF